MKKNLKLFFLVSLFIIIITGCGIKNNDDIIKKLVKKQENCNSYYVQGTMEIINNENTYTYNVKVSYKKKDYYKIDLINTLNNHEQVILKNDEGVYVVTPSLNKSFKFQSDWPYNNSQIYLLNSIIDDLSKDEDRTFKAKNNDYYFTSNVNYPNNKSLIKQNVLIDKNLKIKKVEVTDKNGKAQITMKFDKIEYNKKFPNDYFELSKLIKINTSKEKNNDNNTTNTTNNDSTTKRDQETNTTNNNNNSKNKETANINDVVYPMYLPSNTTLANKEVVNTDNGERLILTFSGDNPFVLIEETVSYSDEGLIIPVSGNLDFLNDVIGVINENSVTFETGGIGYYIVSDKLEKTELVNIARSISILPVSK